MSKNGFYIDSIKNESNKTIVEWHYNGKLQIKISEPLWITPNCRNVHEAHSFILSVFLPIASAVGEAVVFQEPISSSVVDFWTKKFVHLSEFFLEPLKVDIFPQEKSIISYENLNKKALLMGGGSDSCSSLIRMIEMGEKPVLARIVEDGIEDGVFKPDEFCLARSYLKNISEKFGLEIASSTTNATRILTSLFNPIREKLNCENFWLIRMSNRNRNSLIVLSYLFFGFIYFFSALASLPENISSISMGSSLDDCAEWFGMGFNYNNTLSYLGLSLESFIWPSKISQYDYIHRNAPEIFNWQKTCPTRPKNDTQWCGICHQCQVSYVMFVACGHKPPFPKVSSISDKCCSLREQDIRKIMNAYIHYMKGQDKDQTIIEDIQEALLNVRDQVDKRALLEIFNTKKIK